MKYILSSMAMICAVILGLSSLSNAFNINLTPEQINEANGYGKKYKGADVFYSDAVKPARFGNYPKGPGGLIMSKYINVVVTSAMKGMKERSLTEEDIKEIQESTVFKVVVNVEEDVQNLEDVQIILKQGINTILPQKIEFGMKYKDKPRSLIGIFPYDKVNPKADTAVLVNTRNYQKKYTVDFSNIK